MATTYSRIIERCRAALGSRCKPGQQRRASSCLQAERRIIEEHGFESALVRAVDCSNHLSRTGRRGHLIGSGCSSMAMYLLDLSEVDPLRYRTHTSRFWITSDCQAPIFRFVVTPAEDDDHGLGMPNGITAHAMTDLEQIPTLLERTLPPVDLSRADQATFDAISFGDTESVFQLGTDTVRELIAKIRPVRIENLAAATALSLIASTQPEVVEAFLRQEAEQTTERNLEEASARRFGSLIFQETIMTLLRRETRLSWEDIGRFLRAAAKGDMSPDHPLWSAAIGGAANRHIGEQDAAELLLQRLATASKWAVCRAHHVANAITSYKAAYYRTHHRADFEAVVQKVTTVC